MRDIKIRAWDFDQEFMFYYQTPDIDDMSVMCMSAAWETQERVSYSPKKEVFFENPEQEPALMLYTTLKDKNDKEIYEGDIIKIWYPPEDIYDATNGVGVVEWEIEKAKENICGVGFTFRDFTRKKVHWGSLNSEYLEVIGNIYEDPELLKK